MNLSLLFECLETEGKKNKVKGTITKTAYSWAIQYTWSLKHPLNASDESKRHLQRIGLQQLDCFVCTQNKAPDRLKLLPSPMWGKTVYAPPELEIVSWDTRWCCNHFAMPAFQVKLLLLEQRWEWQGFAEGGGKAPEPCQGLWTDVLLGQHYQLQTNRPWAALLLTTDAAWRKSWNSRSSLGMLRGQLTILLVTISSCFFCEARRNILIKMTILRIRRKITILDDRFTMKENGHK